MITLEMQLEYYLVTFGWSKFNKVEFIVGTGIGHTGIWNIEVAKRKHKFDRLLARSIPYLFSIPPESTADIGCGKGDYCSYLASVAGWPNVTGYEGTVGIEKLSGAYSKIIHVDLAKESAKAIVEPAEFVLCLEVGEHIPAKYEKIFLDLLNFVVSYSLLISWATPQQGGTGHVNPKNRQEVMEIFEGFGFRLHSSKT